MDDLTHLARAGRRLKGFAQTINLGADIFLADKNGEADQLGYRFYGLVTRGDADGLSDELHRQTLNIIANPPRVKMR